MDPVTPAGGPAGRPDTDSSEDRRRSLRGRTIGITADRRWEEQAALLRRRGATVIHAPSIATRLVATDGLLRQRTDQLIERPPDYLVATTGIGIRVWFEAAEAWGVREQLATALGQAKIAARGPKSAAALVSAGLPVWRRAASEQLDEIVELLKEEDLLDRHVTVQQYGEELPAFLAAVGQTGAAVSTVSVYQWVLPDDRGPALALIDGACARTVDAVTFTAAPAVRNLFQMAADVGLADDLRGAFNTAVVAACVGPVCAAAAIEAGVDEPLAPDVGRLGLLVRMLSDHFVPGGVT